MNISQRLARLERENAARKALYPVAGSLVRARVEYSPTYEVRARTDENVVVRIELATGQRAVVYAEMAVHISLRRDFSVLYPGTFGWCEPQTGDGRVVVRARLPLAMSETTERYFVRVVLLGAVKGEWRKL